MSEQINNPEEIITRVEILNLLDERGIEDEFVRERLQKYAEQCEKTAEQKALGESGKVSSLANLECAFEMAKLYFASKRYRQEGIEALEEVLLAASQDDFSSELAAQVLSILESNY